MSYLSDPLILLIDDNEIDNFITKKLLHVRGISSNVSTYTRASEALEYLIDNQDNDLRIPDVILLDIHMPEMNGFQFLEAYKKLPESFRENISVFILSSTGDPKDVGKVRSNNMVTDILIKPLDIKILKEILTNKSKLDATRYCEARSNSHG